jgi:hypothetical protein
MRGTVELTNCPDCALPAEVHGRFVLASTDGPVEHLRIRCVRGHVFTLPVFLLEQVRVPDPDPSPRRPAPAPPT